MTIRSTTATSPTGRPDDHATILLVTDAAARVVWQRLSGTVQVVKLADGPRNRPRYRIVPRVQNAGQAIPPASPLTARELQVLGQAALGMTNAKIGVELHISANTVCTHMKRILRRMSAVDRTNAVHIAHIRGWLSGPESAE